DTVHDSCGCRIAPVQPSDSGLKDQVSAGGNPAPATVTAVTATCPPPAAALFFSVTIPVPVGTPLGSVIVSGFGVSTIGGTLATPLPCSCTTCEATPPAPETVSVPLNVVGLVGVNTRFTVHEAPGFRVAPQVPPTPAPLAGEKPAPLVA